MVGLFGFGFRWGGGEDGGCGGEILEGDTGRSGGTFCEGWFEDVEGEERHRLALVGGLNRACQLVKLVILHRVTNIRPILDLFSVTHNVNDKGRRIHRGYFNCLHILSNMNRRSYP